MQAPTTHRLTPIHRSMRRVAQRVFARQFWWMICILGLALVGFGMLLLGAVRTESLSETTGLITFIAASVVAFMVSFQTANAKRRDTNWIARQIEKKYPSLNQRLFTVMSMEPDQNLGYLGQQVVEETRAHDYRFRWDRLVSGFSLLTGRLAGSAVILVATFLGMKIATGGPKAVEAQAIASISPEGSGLMVTVEPGDTDVERGTSLSVIARFNGQVPETAQLVCIDADGDERRYTMRQNLEDPILGGFIPPIDKPIQYRVETDNWISDDFNIGVFEFPSLVRSDAVLDYPEYTSMDDKRIEDTIRVSAVEGSKVTWQCFLNKEVESCTLVAKDGQTIEMIPAADGNGSLEATFDLKKTERFTLKLVDDAGRENKYPPELVAKMLPNQPPKIKLAKARDFSVSPLEELTLTATARDDFGVSQVGLSYIFADEEEKEIVLAENLARGASEELSHLLAFENLNAEPDQLLAYHFWAEDVGPDGIARRVSSDMFFAEVRPFEEIFREGDSPQGGQQQQGQQQGGAAQETQKLVELQKQIMTATWNVSRRETGESVTDMFAEDVGTIAESQSDAIELLTELLEKVSDDKSGEIAIEAGREMGKAADLLSQAASEKDPRVLTSAMTAERKAYANLLKLRAHEFEVARSRQRQQSQGGGASQQQRQRQIDELEIKQDENRYQQQQAAQQNAEQDAQAAEERQVLSRLRELAQRSEDLNKELAKLQSALEEAETEEEKDEIERQLKRLREQQQDLLRQTDELSERMRSPENQETMSEQADKLEETRQNLRKASEALEQNDASKALSAGKRAEREFEELRDEFRRRTAGQFNDQMREMRNEAQELDERQKDLTEQLESRNNESERSPGLRRNNEQTKLEDQIREERKKLDDLLQDMQQTVQDSEEAEPLLAQKLYDSYRRTRQQQVDRRLENSARLLEQGYNQQATEFQKEAGRGITELRENIEEAAESVLGDETEGLRRASEQLDQLSRDLDNELDRESPGTREPSDDERQGPNGQRNGRENENGENPSEQDSQGQPRDGQPRDGQPRDGQPQEGDGRSQQQQNDDQRQRGGGQPGEDQENQSEQQREGSQRQNSADQENQNENQQRENQPGQGQPGQRQPGQGQPNENQQPGNQPNEGNPESQQSQSQQSQTQPGSGQANENASENRQRQRPGLRGGQNEQQQPNRAAQTPTRNRSGRESNRGGSPYAADSPANSPLTGDFRNWSDELRDVEEMVGDPDLRSRAAQIRDRARQMRAEMERHSKLPQWDLVEELVAQPLRELKRDVKLEYLRRAAEKNALVPIDRDPVPDRFTEAVRQYYENLGSGR